MVERDIANKEYENASNAYSELLDRIKETKGRLTTAIQEHKSEEEINRIRYELENMNGPLMEEATQRITDAANNIKLIEDNNRIREEIERAKELQKIEDEDKEKADNENAYYKKTEEDWKDYFSGIRNDYTDTEEHGPIKYIKTPEEKEQAFNNSTKSLEDRFFDLVKREEELSKEIENLSGPELEAKLSELDQLAKEYAEVEALLTQVGESPLKAEYQKASEEFDKFYNKYQEVGREIKNLQENNEDFKDKTEELKEYERLMDEAGQRMMAIHNDETEELKLEEIVPDEPKKEVVEVEEDRVIDGSFEPFIIDISDIDKIKIEESDYEKNVDERLQALNNELELLNNPYHKWKDSTIDKELSKLQVSLITSNSDLEKEEINNKISLITEEKNRRTNNETGLGLNKRQIKSQIKLLEKQKEDNALATRISNEIGLLEEELRGRRENIQERSNAFSDPAYSELVEKIKVSDNAAIQSLIDDSYSRLSRLTIDPIETGIDSRSVSTSMNGEDFVEEKSNLVVHREGEAFEFSNGTYISFSELFDAIDRAFEDFSPTRTVTVQKTGKKYDVDDLKAIIVEASTLDSVIRVDDREKGKNNRNLSLKEAGSLNDESINLEDQEYKNTRNVTLQKGFLDALPRDEIANDYFVRLEAVKEIMEPLGISFNNSVRPYSTMLDSDGNKLPPIGALINPDGITFNNQTGSNDSSNTDNGSSTGTSDNGTTGSTNPTGNTGTQGSNGISPIDKTPVVNEDSVHNTINVDSEELINEVARANNDMLARYYGDRRLEKAYRKAMEIYKSHIHNDDNGVMTIDDFPERENIERTFHLEDFESKLQAVNDYELHKDEENYISKYDYQIMVAEALELDLCSNLNRSDYESPAAYRKAMIEQLVQADKHYIESLNENYSSFAATQEHLKTLGKHGEWKPYLKLTKDENGKTKINLGNIVKVGGNALIASQNIFKVLPNKLFGTYIAAPIQKLIHDPVKKAGGAYNNKRTHRYAARVDAFTKLLEHELMEKCRDEKRAPKVSERIKITFAARLQALTNWKEGNKMVTQMQAVANYENAKKREEIKQLKNNRIKELNEQVNNNNLELIKLNDLLKQNPSEEDVARINARISELNKDNKKLNSGVQIINSANIEGIVSTQVDAISEDLHKKANKENITNVVTGVKLVGKVALAKLSFDNIKKKVVRQEEIVIQPEKVIKVEEFDQEKVRNLTLRDLLDKTESDKSMRNVFNPNAISTEVHDDNILGFQFFDETGRSLSANTFSETNGSGVRLVNTVLDGWSNGIPEDATIWEVMAKMYVNSGKDPSATAEKMLERFGSSEEKLQEFLNNCNVLASDTYGMQTSGWVKFVGNTKEVVSTIKEEVVPAVKDIREVVEEVVDKKMALLTGGIGVSALGDLYDSLRRTNSKEEIQEFKEQGELNPERIEKEAKETVERKEDAEAKFSEGKMTINNLSFNPNISFGTREDYINSRDKEIVDKIVESIDTAYESYDAPTNSNGRSR